jgi:membrane fusion protein, heavy metal efflux system
MNDTLTIKRTLARSLCMILATLIFVSPTYAESESEEGEDHDEGHIELSQEQIDHAGIALEKVRSGPLQEVLTVYGTIRSNPEQVQRVSARFDGAVRKIDKRIGDSVKRGDTILTVEANESMQDYPINATIDGVVTHREANIGEQTNGRTLLVIEDLSTVWVELSLFSQDLPLVHVGQKVRINSKKRDVTAEGLVTYIAPMGISSSQTVLARVPLPNPERRWTPGQFVVGDIILSEANVPLLVNTEALQIVENRPVIFVQGEEGFEPRPVQIGRSDGRSTEVLGGLSSGEIYVTKNSFVLKSELGKEDAEHGH